MNLFVGRVRAKLHAYRIHSWRDSYTLPADMQAILAKNGEELARNFRRHVQDETQQDGFVADNGHLALITLLGAGPDSKTTEYALFAVNEPCVRFGLGC